MPEMQLYAGLDAAADLRAPRLPAFSPGHAGASVAPHLDTLPGRPGVPTWAPFWGRHYDGCG